MWALLLCSSAHSPPTAAAAAAAAPPAAAAAAAALLSHNLGPVGRAPSAKALVAGFGSSKWLAARPVLYPQPRRHHSGQRSVKQKGDGRLSDSLRVGTKSTATNKHEGCEGGGS